MFKKTLIYFILIAEISCSQNTKNIEQIFFEDFSIKEEGQIINDKKEGKWKYYDRNKKNYALVTYRKGKREGKAIYYYDNGEKSHIINYKNDTIKVGTFKEYYNNGELKEIGNYDNNGKKIEEWKWYYENGKIKKRGFFNSKSKRIGKWEWFFKNGKLEELKTYTQDSKPINIWVEYYENGKEYSIANFNKNTYTIFSDDGETVLGKGAFKDGEPHGKWMYYYKDGDIRGEINYDEGELKGEYYFQNNEKKIDKKYTHLSDSTYTGSYIEYYKNGNLKFKREYDVKGKPIGAWESYFENGKIKAKKEYDSTNKRVGEWKEYFSNGQIKTFTVFPDGKHYVYYEDTTLMIEGKMKNYEPHGKWKKYFKDGSLQAISNYPNGTHLEYDYKDNKYVKVKGTYKNGKENGEWTVYHDNGSIDEVGKMIKGKKEGEWKIFYPDSSVFKTSIYKNNKIIAEKYYQKDENKTYVYLKTKIDKKGDYDCKKYYVTGKLLAEGKLDVNLNMIGRWNNYSKEGKVNAIDYLSPLHTRMRKEFYENGNLKSIKFYDIGDKQIGKYKEFLLDGRIKREGTLE